LIPIVQEKLDIEVTAVTLPMLSLIPESVERELKEIVGDNYSSLTELDRNILVLAHGWGEVSNTDIQRYRQEHPKEIGDCLKRLVNRGWLEQFGHGRGTRYTLPDQNATDLLSLISSSEHYEQNSEHYEQNSEHYEQNSEHYEQNSEHYERLIEIASPVREKRRVSKEIVEEVILKLCRGQYLQLRTLAKLLNRDSDSIRNHYITPMLEKRLLRSKYPDQPNHPNQAYRTIAEAIEED
jgi:ATP-dependent DNA helicase RecG